MDKQLAGLNVVGCATATISGTTAASLPGLSDGKVNSRTVRRIYLTTETGNLRWRADSTAPTIGTGHLMASGESISFTGANYKQLIKAFKMIGSGSAIPVTVTYFD